MKIKYFVVLAILVTAIFGFGGIANAAQENIVTDCLSTVGGTNYSTVERISCLQNLIARIMQQIKQLQSQQGDNSTQVWCHTFEKNLKIGDTGSGVFPLRTALSKSGFQVDGIGGEGGDEFDEETASLVIKLQSK